MKMEAPSNPIRSPSLLSPAGCPSSLRAKIAAPGRKIRIPLCQGGSKLMKVTREPTGSSHLPLDIIIEILIRLPVKTLYKFRCVSKSWYALISDPIFHKSHYKRSKQNPFLLITSSVDFECKELHFSSMDNKGTTINKFVKTCPYCADMVLTCLDMVCFYHVNDPYIYLCNPATEELIALPLKSCSPRGGSCDDSVGLGYVSSTKEYKVFRVFRKNPAVSRFSYAIFTLGSDINDRCWRKVRDPPFVGVGRSVLIRGSFHLLTDRNRYPQFEGIAVFDIEREEWSMLPPPAELTTFGKLRPIPMVLGELGGLLCLTVRCPTHFDFIDIWLLKNYDKGLWVKEYTVNVAPWDVGNFYIKTLPVSIADDGRVLMARIRVGLQYYDPVSRRFEEFIFRTDGYFRASLYVESFISLGTGTFK